MRWYEKQIDPQPGRRPRGLRPLEIYQERIMVGAFNYSGAWFVNCVIVPILNRYSGAHIELLRNQHFCASGNRGREWFRDDVQQYFTRLARASSDSVSFLILQHINLAVKVQRKHHRYCAHVFPGQAVAQLSYRFTWFETGNDTWFPEPMQTGKEFREDQK